MHGNHFAIVLLINEKYLIEITLSTISTVNVYDAVVSLSKFEAVVMLPEAASIYR